MKLEKRVFRGFLIFSLAAGLCLGCIYTFNAGRSYVETEKSWMNHMVELSASRMADIVSQSEFMYIMLLSDTDTLNAIKTLAGDSVREGDFASLYYSETYETIRGKIQNCFFYGQSYRIIYFNQRGDVIAASNQPDWSVDTSFSWENIENLNEMKAGTACIIPVHKDEWGKSHNKMVFSVRKKLVGTNLGCFEIQWLKEDLDDLFVSGDNTYDVYFYNEDGNLLYTTKETETDYFSLTQKKSKGSGNLKVKGRAIGYSTDTDTGITTVVLEQSNYYWKIAIKIVPVLLILMGAFFLFAMWYSRTSARNLVKPILCLRDTMEKTDIDNMTRSNQELKAYIHSSEETEALYQSFFGVMERLSNSISREKRLSVLQLQAQMDLLQAQVNPHFLYNILNVISAKGIMANDESICDICSCLSKMLRYSTNTRDKLGTVREEKEYLELYFRLLKYRYEHCFEYAIQIDPAIEKELFPKMSLEQIAENSVLHGFSDRKEPLKIEVTGVATKEKWILNVHDNGKGFTESRRKEIEERLLQMRGQLSKEREHVELEIGGMGLINTYARLYLTFGEKLIFRIHSDENGTDVGFGVLGSMEETKENV